MDWREVLLRDDVVGGDIKSQGVRSVSRGPVKKAWIEGAQVCFETEWAACRSLSSGQHWPVPWSHGVTSIFFAPITATPNLIGGVISCMRPSRSPLVIFLKGGDRLDPSVVKGLEIH